jgi:hypothetical protein
MLVLAMIKTAIHFSKTILLLKYVSHLEANKDVTKLLDIEKDCLSKLVCLAQQHFDLTKDHEL